jgi:hypothetical protein
MSSELCSQTVYEAAHKDIDLEKLPAVELKSKTTRIDLYCPLGMRSEVDRKHRLLEAQHVLVSENSHWGFVDVDVQQATFARDE